MTLGVVYAVSHHRSQDLLFRQAQSLSPIAGDASMDFPLHTQDM